MDRKDRKDSRARQDADVEPVDIAAYHRPLCDEPRSPRTGACAHDHTRAWVAKIAELDAFVFVTPEYCQSILASVKNAIDFVYHEWNNKAADYVGYGGQISGSHAVDHLRHIAGALQPAAVHTQINLSLKTTSRRSRPSHPPGATRRC